MATTRDLIYALEEKLHAVTELVGAIGDSLMQNADPPPAPPEDPPVPDPPGALTAQELLALSKIYSVPNSGIQVSKQNPKRYGGTIGVEHKKGSPKNGYGVTLAQAYKNYKGPLGIGLDMPISEKEQGEWRFFLDKVTYPTAIRQDGDGKLTTDFFRPSLEPVRQYSGFISRYEALKAANALPKE